MMYVLHILIDITWLVILAMKGRRLIGSKCYRALLAIYGSPSCYAA